MINGVTLESREAVIRLRVFGNGNGIVHEVQAVIDTGFTDDLTLPSDLTDALQLTFLRWEKVRQSDGLLMEFAIHEADVEWDGQRITVEVQVSETETLVGMGLIWGYKLTMMGEPNGAVTLTVLEGGDTA